MPKTKKFLISKACDGQWVLTWPERPFGSAGGATYRCFTGTKTFEEAVQLMCLVERNGYERPYS